MDGETIPPVLPRYQDASYLWKRTRRILGRSNHRKREILFKFLKLVACTIVMSVVPHDSPVRLASLSMRDLDGVSNCRFNFPTSIYS